MAHFTGKNAHNYIFACLSAQYFVNGHRLFTVVVVVINKSPLTKSGEKAGLVYVLSHNDKSVLQVGDKAMFVNNVLQQT